MTITEWITLGYLGILSVWDIRKKELPVSLLAVGGGMALIRELFMLVTKQWSIQDAAIGAIPGLALVQGGVGTGDGLVLLILGGLFGRKACVGGFLWGSFGAAAAAGLFWWFGK